MIELILDTSYIGLNIGITKDSILIDKIEIEANRKQSELTMPKLDEIFKKNNIDPQTIKRVIITEGPGSFTGLRIAMTIAKVICSMINCELYTINTLFAYIHPSIKKGFAIMDARSKRAYIAQIENEVVTLNPQVIEIKDINIEEAEFFGDAHLIDKESSQFSIIDNILANKHLWKKVNDVDALVPLYLKDNSDYGN